MAPKSVGGQRVAMLAHTLYLFDPRVRREAEALAEKGVEVHVIGLSEEGYTAQPQLSNAIVNGVHIHRLPIKKKRGNSLRYLYEYFMTGFLGGLKLAALHFRGKVNVVHIHNMPDILILSAVVPRLGGSKLVLDIHDPMPELSMNSSTGISGKLLVRFLRLQEKVSCWLADRVISVNESMRENLRAKGVSDDKIFIVHNFPDQRVFPICDIPVSWPRNANGLTLLYCGTVTKDYDLSLVVKAIARLAGEVPIKLRIAGAGTTLAEVLNLARSLGVADSIEVIGVIPLERVHEEMRKADVGISCQRGSVFGDLCFSTKIVEYLTQGLPVLTPQTYTVSKQLLPSLSWQAEKDRFLAFYTDLINDTRPAVRIGAGNESCDQHPIDLRERRKCSLSLAQSNERVQRWVESRDYKAYEPFDGLSSYLRPLTFGNLFLDRILLQVVRQSPINLRPLLGIKPLESTKGRGYMAWGYLALFELTGTEEYKEKAIACLEWLTRKKSPLYPDHSWANHFDFASRAGRYSKHESIIVWTALIGQAFLDGYEILREERYLEIAKSICNWILKLPRERTDAGTCLSYMATTMSSIHNSNMLGAAMLARTAKHTGEAELFHVAKASMEYSCSRQLPDGGWFYAESAQCHWIDNFHTGYNLDSLKCYIESSGDETFRPQLDLGFRYFKTTFFDAFGRPSYYHNRSYPIDIQCASQAIETFANFADYDHDALPMALKVAQWTIEHMQDSAGYFYYRRYPLTVARTPMLHWGQATMFRALALLQLKLAQQQTSREANASEVPDRPLREVASL